MGGRRRRSVRALRERSTGSHRNRVYREVRTSLDHPSQAGRAAHDPQCEASRERSKHRRSGSQGDPGDSRFYLSLEDDLMRLFASDRIAGMMDRLKIPDEVPIEAKIVSRAIERAQSQVEAMNFEIRKNVLKYDEVMDKQR